MVEKNASMCVRAATDVVTGCSDAGLHVLAAAVGQVAENMGGEWLALRIAWVASAGDARREAAAVMASGASSVARLLSGGSSSTLRLLLADQIAAMECFDYLGALVVALGNIRRFGRHEGARWDPEAEIWLATAWTVRARA